MQSGFAASLDCCAFARDDRFKMLYSMRDDFRGSEQMQRTRAPFRADEVGSLLRPPKIKEARARLEKSEIAAADLRKIEDMEIEKVVHKQASIGVKLATD